MVLVSLHMYVQVLVVCAHVCGSQSTTLGTISWESIILVFGDRLSLAHQLGYPRRSARGLARLHLLSAEGYVWASPCPAWPVDLGEGSQSSLTGQTSQAEQSLRPLFIVGFVQFLKTKYTCAEVPPSLPL